jgi:hypothetical protein
MGVELYLDPSTSHYLYIRREDNLVEWEAGRLSSIVALRDRVIIEDVLDHPVRLPRSDITKFEITEIGVALRLAFALVPLYVSGDTSVRVDPDIATYWVTRGRESQELGRYIKIYYTTRRNILVIQRECSPWSVIIDANKLRDLRVDRVLVRKYYTIDLEDTGEE